MKQSESQNSQLNLKVGLEMVGKLAINACEWNGKFAQLQNKHRQTRQTSQKKSKFSHAISSFFKTKIGMEVCGLCQLERKKEEMEQLCRCPHSYCYSCLNSYAIFKIEDIALVKCPHQECSELMVLTSNIYRYLPDLVKLKYLQYRHTFRADQESEEKRCQRCHELRHSGECLYTFSPQMVEQSFKYRECPKCKIEIMMTSGFRKVNCHTCGNILCYMCGIDWKPDHQCLIKQQVRDLEKQQGYRECQCSQCCECCNYGCEGRCACCGDLCCRSCGGCYMQQFCCEIMFNCENNCSPGCCIWNICSVPVRFLLTVLLLSLFLIFFSLVLVVLTIWLVICIFFGAFYCSFELICKTGGVLAVVMGLLFPLTAIIGIFLALSDTVEIPLRILRDFSMILCEMMGNVWLEMSPKNCNCN